MAENNELDIVGTCREVLLALLSGKAPEEALLTLTGSGISEEDAQALVNVTIACAQEVSPVIEGGAVMWQAIDALVKQGVEKPLAESLVKMVVAVMNEQQRETAAATATKTTGVAPAEIVVNEEQTKILMRLGLVVDTDLQRGVPVEGIAAAIENIPDIGEYPEVHGKATEFVDNVRLARAACNLAQTGSPLAEVVKDLGLDKKPPYVAILAIFFQKLLPS